MNALHVLMAHHRTETLIVGGGVCGTHLATRLARDLLEPFLLEALWLSGSEVALSEGGDVEGSVVAAEATSEALT